MYLMKNSKKIILNIILVNKKNRYLKSYLFFCYYSSEEEVSFIDLLDLEVFFVLLLLLLAELFVLLFFINLPPLVLCSNIE